LLGLQHEGITPVEVDAAIAEGAVPEGNLHRILKGVAVGVGIRRAGHLQQITELAQEELGVRPLGSLCTRPSGDEGVGGCGRFRGRGHGGKTVSDR